MTRVLALLASLPVSLAQTSSLDGVKAAQATAGGATKDAPVAIFFGKPGDQKSDATLPLFERASEDTTALCANDKMYCMSFVRSAIQPMPTGPHAA